MPDSSDLTQVRRDVHYLMDRTVILDAWANSIHAATSANHLHNITTHHCEIDRLTRRNGTWRIAVRHATVELAHTADARLLQSPYFASQGYQHRTRARSDLSYSRPLQP
jgi:hypothetical protein